MLGTGLQNYFGGWFSDNVGCFVQENPSYQAWELGTARETPELFVNWSMWMPIIPSRYSITSSPVFGGHQETWNAAVFRCWELQQYE